MAPPTPPGRDETLSDSDESDKHRVLGTFDIEGSYTNLPDFYCELFNKKRRKRIFVVETFVGDYYATHGNRSVAGGN